MCSQVDFNSKTIAAHVVGLTRTMDRFRRFLRNSKGFDDSETSVQMNLNRGQSSGTKSIVLYCCDAREYTNKHSRTVMK